MKTTCPGCGTSYRVSEAHVGRTLTCKKCSARLAVSPAGLVRAEDTLDEAPAPPPTAAVYQYAPPPPARPAPVADTADTVERDRYDGHDPPRRRTSAAGGGPVVDFITFRLMLTPLLIAVVFWVGTAVCVGYGAETMAGSFAAERVPGRVADDDRGPRPRGRADAPAADEVQTRFDRAQFVRGLALAVLGPILLRLYCETSIVFFKIHDELKLANRRPR